ncbi:hypothetical protein [Acidithiobacillus ferriphilus]|uniref:hypothetical protein n=1 Tax=Acidithiobacillus ferriphilus TaxID=1689834 RepID=UPI002DBE3158|nr:hypothetical protein [Acidithiobacillus ferriphilus]MEB8476121.1 hypothetical protein [Acidithiobacillus ferriphilus]
MSTVKAGVLGTLAFVLGMILTGVAWTREAVAGTSQGAYGFRPGEWRIHSTTTGVFGIQKSIFMKCYHSPQLAQTQASGILPGSTPGPMHGTVVHVSKHETVVNETTELHGWHETTTDVLHAVYTGSGTDYHMQWKYVITQISNGLKQVTTNVMRGVWISPVCLVHPPLATQSSTPSRQMLAIQAAAAKATVEAAQTKKAMPAEMAQANAALAAMKASIAKMIAKDARAGVVIPPQH